MDLRLVHVSSAKNLADHKSRKLKLSNAMLPRVKRNFVERKFGPILQT